MGDVYLMTPFVVLFGAGGGLPLADRCRASRSSWRRSSGWLNGVITIEAGVPSFIVTLGMLLIVSGFTLTISDGFPKRAPRGGFADFFGGAEFSGFCGRWDSRS